MLATKKVADRRPGPPPTLRTLPSATTPRITIDDRTTPLLLRAGTTARTAVRKTWRGETRVAGPRAYLPASAATTTTTTIAVERMGPCRLVKLTSRRSHITITVAAAAAAAVEIGCQAVVINHLPEAGVVVYLTRAVTETLRATYP